MKKVNGITLGKDSPLHSVSKYLPGGGRTEEDDQRDLMALLVGPAIKGQDRDPRGGLCPKYPELYLLTAIPNAGAGASRGMAGRMKAMGVMPGYPDLHLPIARGPFLTLYVEMKRAGGKSSAAQLAVQQMLRNEGHCVIQCVGVEEGAAVILGYLAMPFVRVDLSGLTGFSGNDYVERILDARRVAEAMLTRKRAP